MQEYTPHVDLQSEPTCTRNVDRKHGHETHHLYASVLLSAGARCLSTDAVSEEEITPATVARRLRRPLQA